MIKQCGIYKIYCTINKKSYIGSSNNVRKRMKEHYNNLNKNKHYNKNLQKAYNKYGSESFLFEILEICTEENRFIREQHYIDLTDKLFNSCKDVVYNKRNKVKESTKLKISISLKNRKLDESQLEHIKNLGSTFGAINGKATCKPIKVIIENKVTIYESASQASRVLNINRSYITKRLNGMVENNQKIKFYYAER